MVRNILVLIVLVAFLFGCDTKRLPDTELSAYVPNNAVWVLKIKNLETLQSESSSNSLLSAFNQASPYQLLNQKNSLLSYLSPTGESVLSLSKRNDSTWDYTLATKQDSLVFVIDSVPNKSIETLTYKGISIQRVSADGAVGFTAIKDSVFVISSSQTQLQSLLENTRPVSAGFNKAFSVLKNNELTSIIRNPTYQFANNEFSELATHTSLDVILSPDGISASGVALAQDTLPRLLSVFQGQIPQQNDLETILPTSARTAVSVTMSDASLLAEKLKQFRRDSADIRKLDLFGSANEFGEIFNENGNAVALKSIDTELTKEALASSISEISTFRDTPLFTFDDGAIFKELFKPFVQTDSVSVVFQLDNFFVFAENNSVAETIISAVKNNATVGKSAAFESASNRISNASSFLTYGMNDGVAPVVKNALQNESFSWDGTVSLKAFPLALLQYRFDRDFAHVHFVCQEHDGAKKSSAGVSELFSKTLDNNVMGMPQFFSNHRSGTKNISVQDITNTLHLFSENGKTLWTKTLEGPILGKIHEVDLLRNGRKQMAFATKNKLHVVDRNGKDVGPFPITFKDGITQPLSVFDYDNNRKYRFAIVQGREILLYDSKGKVVNGFTFRTAKSPIVLPAEHIRMGNKDYVVIAEENGTLHIVSRVGKPRVTVNRKFDFSENPIEREGSSFVVISKDKQKHSIATNGKVTSQTLEVSNDYHFITIGSTKVTMDDNLLRINGKLAELPLGIYTQPQLFVANRNLYIAVTETQEKKVYVFQKNGTLVNGFPVFGSSQVSLSESKGKALLVVKGQDNEIVLFQL